MNQVDIEIPRRLEVSELISSRYPDGVRPSSWDIRIGGIDIIRASDGKTYKLQSDGGQSPPQKGWAIILSAGDASAGYTWTLYGFPNVEVSARH